MQPDTVAQIVQQWRQRQAWHSAEKILTLQAKALCRGLVGGDKGEAGELYDAVVAGDATQALAAIAAAAIGPLLAGQEPIKAARKSCEKTLIALAAALPLPVVQMVETTRGFGYLSLAGIVGEAGDIGSYASHEKLWKRMGLAVMGDGGRQRRVKDADEALAHGYSPRRRSVAWVIGEALIRAGGPHKAIYDARKLIEAGRVATKGHAHNRAKRYMEKRLLRDLWRAWRRAITSSRENAVVAVPDAAIDQASGAIQYAPTEGHFLPAPPPDLDQADAAELAVPMRASTQQRRRPVPNQASGAVEVVTARSGKTPRRSSEPEKHYAGGSGGADAWMIGTNRGGT